jgi:tetratricopeptide (TPR) repeat protein
MEMMNLEDIELYCNFDFEPEIKKKYSNIIIDIFNNKCPGKYYNNSIDTDMMIIIALYDISKKDYENAIDILLEAINRDSMRALCTLGILYNILNNKEKSIYYFKKGADKGHILSSTNLAFEYLCQGEFDLFLKYNQIGLDKTEGSDENALINKAIYLWNVLKNYDEATIVFNKIIKTNYRACYEYAKLVGNVEQKKELLINAIKLKPKICYINMLKKITNNFERYELYKNYNIKTETFQNYDNINQKYHMSRYSQCPICIKTNSNKIELFTLKCDHSFCRNCIKKYCKKNCYLCYK